MTHADNSDVSGFSQQFQLTDVFKDASPVGIPSKSVGVRGGTNHFVSTTGWQNPDGQGLLYPNFAVVVVFIHKMAHCAHCSSFFFKPIKKQTLIIFPSARSLC